MTNKDFWLGFLCGVLFIVLLFILAPQPPTKRSKRQPVADESKWGDLTDDEREKLRKAG